MTNQELLNRITINPNIAFGKPTIRGLRYSVEWLLETLSSGMTNEEILADYGPDGKLAGLEILDAHRVLSQTSGRVIFEIEPALVTASPQ